MACDTNMRPIDLHESIELGTPIHQWDLSDKRVLPDETCQVADKGCEIVEDEEGQEEGNESGMTVMELSTSIVSERMPLTSITMPSVDIEEISQSFYWPLYSKPIDWIYEERMALNLNKTDRLNRVRRVAQELQSLSFAMSQDHSAIGDTEGEDRPAAEEGDHAVVEKLVLELQEEKEDWFSELSGGQKSKIELVRKVFLRDECPSVLLGES